VDRYSVYATMEERSDGMLLWTSVHVTETGSNEDTRSRDARMLQRETLHRVLKA